MPPEDANEASQSQDVSLDDLHRAAEEARSIPDQEETTNYEEEHREESSTVTPDSTEETPSETSETEREETEQPTEPKDNKERSQLGRKVASLEGTLKVYEQQIQQMDQNFQVLTALLNQQQPHAADTTGTETAEEEDEYIPQTRKEFDALLEKRVRQIQEREVQQQTVQRTQYEQGYLSTLAKFGSDSDDPALHEEAFKLTTEAGAPYNVARTGNASVDAEINYHAAQAHVLKQRLSRPKKEEAKQNPLKGEPPRAPLGAPSGAAPKPKEQPPVKLDGYATNAARRFTNPATSKPYTTAELSEMLK